MSVNEKQIGGGHYMAPIQHWDFVEKNRLGYLEGCATKYATRNRKKHENPREDLSKSLHYVEKTLELYSAGVKRPRTSATLITVGDFAEANGLTANETRVVHLLTYWGCKEDLEKACEVIRQMIAEVG